MSLTGSICLDIFHTWIFFLNNKRYKFVSMLYKYCLLFGIFSQNLTQKLVFKTRKTI